MKRKEVDPDCEHPQTPCVAMAGDIFIDIMAPINRLPAWDTDVETESVKMLPGGSALNQGRQLHALGIEVQFFGAVGNDAMGQSLISKISEQGFPTEQIKMLDNISSSVCIVLSGQSDRAMVSCYSTNNAFAASFLSERTDRIYRCSHFHLGGYFGMRGLQNLEFTDVVQGCRAKKMTISLSTQYDPSEKFSGHENHLSQLLPHVDVLFVNMTEAKNIAAALLPSWLPSSSCEPKDLCEEFPKLNLVVTDGKAGCSIIRSGQAPVLVPTTEATVVDSTGAGDAFVAGFLSSWLRNHDLIAAAERGHEVARICVGREGACVEPIRQEDLRI